MQQRQPSVLRSSQGNTGHQVKKLIRWLNYVLLAAAVSSAIVVFEIRKSPTPWGWAFLMVAVVSILSAVTACFSSPDETGHFFIHLFLLFSSLIGQGSSFLMFFAKPDLNLQYLKPRKSEHDTRVLMKVDAALFLFMFCIQLAVLILACASYNCDFVDDYEDLEAKTIRKGRHLAKVQEESVARAAKKESEAAQELSKKMKDKYGLWTQEGEFDTKK